MTLQLEWENPIYVSQSNLRDTLKIMVIDPFTFLDKFNMLGFKNETIVLGQIPPQVISSDPTNVLLSIMDLIKSVVNVVIYGHIILHPVTTFSLSLIWGLVHGL